MKRRIIAYLVLILTAPITLAQQAAWIGSWGASPLPPRAAAGPFPATPSFNNQTIRQIVRLSAGGQRLRLRLTNEYGRMPLEIGAARIAILDADGEPIPESQRVVTFDGSASAMIAAGAPLLSDPVALALDDLATIEISLYLPDETGPCTCHATGMQDSYVSQPGDFTSARFTPADTIRSRAFLSGIEVWTPAAGVVVTLGDSITDGVGSTSGANQRWPDVLAERLAARSGDGRFGVVNHGISGNRILSDGAGESALARFDRDVLSVPGVTHVVIFEGINDLGIGFGRLEGASARSAMPPSTMAVTAVSMITGYRQLIARAHAKGLKVYGATIAPFEGASYYSADGEAARQAVNSWIRNSGEFDAVLDFDAALADPNAPKRIADGLHSGDYLHGSDAGYDVIANSIDLSLF